MKSKQVKEHKGFEVDWTVTRFVGEYGFSVSKGSYTERSVMTFTEPSLAIEEGCALIDLGLFHENYAWYLQDTGLKS